MFWFASLTSIGLSILNLFVIIAIVMFLIIIVIMLSMRASVNHLGSRPFGSDCFAAPQIQ